MLNKEGLTLLRGVTIALLIIQSIGAGIWWGILWRVPEMRRLFLAPEAPISTLFSFSLPDAILILMGGLVSAWGIAQRKTWAGVALSLHTGAIVYAGLYALALPLFSGGAWLGCVLMLPSMICLPLLLWKLYTEKAL